MVDELSKRLVPDELWGLVEPLLPEFSPRKQGGGTTPVSQRAVFTAVVCVLTSGCAWRMLPPSFGVSVPTAHRRFSVWTRKGIHFCAYLTLAAALTCHKRLANLPPVVG